MKKKWWGIVFIIILALTILLYIFVTHPSLSPFQPGSQNIDNQLNAEEPNCDYRYREWGWQPGLLEHCKLACRDYFPDDVEKCESDIANRRFGGCEPNNACNLNKERAGGDCRITQGSDGRYFAVVNSRSCKSDIFGCHCRKDINIASSN